MGRQYPEASSVPLLTNRSLVPAAGFNLPTKIKTELSNARSPPRGVDGRRRVCFAPIVVVQQYNPELQPRKGPPIRQMERSRHSWTTVDDLFLKIEVTYCVSFSTMRSLLRFYHYCRRPAFSISIDTSTRESTHFVVGPLSR